MLWYCVLFFCFKYISLNLPAYKMKATYAVILCFVNVAGKLYSILTYIDFS